MAKELVVGRSEETHTLEPERSKAQRIAAHIGHYYAHMKEREELHNLMREVSEEHILNLTIEKELPVELETLEFRFLDGELSAEEFEEAKRQLRSQAKVLIHDTYLFNEVLMKYKKRTTWHWKKEFDEELEDAGYLHVCKRIMKAQELRYDIQAFQQEPTPYLKVFSGDGETKEEKEKRKQQEAAERLHKKKELQNLNIDEMVELFKKNQRALTQLKNDFVADKAELLLAMSAEAREKIVADEEVGMGFKVYDKAGAYDKEQILFSDLDKRFFFFFKTLENGITECTDWITGEEFAFADSFDFHGHHLSRNGKHLVVDGYMLETYPPDEVETLGKVQKKKAVQNGFSVAMGILQVSGADFFKDCPTSSTEVDALIERNALHPSVRKQYRYMKSQADMSITFEMIESEKDAKRGSFFQQKKTWHTATVLRDQEAARWYTESQN